MKFEKMKIVNPNAGGIDVGSKSHLVALGREKEDVFEFGVFTKDHETLIDFLHAHGIETIAMESTGSYWQTLFFALQEAGFEVILVSGHQTKNVRAKTDVKGSQWIQKLHSLGLLRGSFLPSEQTKRLRILYRHRSSLVEEAAKMSNKMNKALRLMNLRLDNIISDITGKSGMAIITVILGGERDGKALSLLADSRVRKLKQEIAESKQFTSFIRLAPNDRISGGKVISSQTPKGSNKLALALRNAANTIDNRKNGISFVSLRILF